VLPASGSSTSRDFSTVGASTFSAEASSSSKGVERRSRHFLVACCAVAAAQQVANQRPKQGRRSKIPAWKRRKNPDLYHNLEEFGSSGAAKRDALRPLQRKPELLAPAGGWPQLKAAVRSGADAVYFGLDIGLNARARAANFSAEDLPEVMQYLHERGVKGMVTLNVLVFNTELFGEPGVAGESTALKALRIVASAGVDAIIVQDPGLALACRQLYPDLPVHASTQMSITNAAGVRFANEVLGAERVVLGRELSLADMKKVRSEVPDVELEAFVHGALCVSYSGQCFSSEAWGGRSANRGQCAQACRLPYALVRDGDLLDFGDGAKYMLSPQDLMAVDRVGELIDAGVCCFKVEGRLKGEEYVSMVTAAYRQAIDEAWQARAPEAYPVSERSVFKKNSAAELLSDERSRRAALAQVFARAQDARYDGLSAGFLDGPRHQALVRGLAPKHRGLLVGSVLDVDSGTGVVSLALAEGGILVPLRRGAGIVFDVPKVEAVLDDEEVVTSEPDKGGAVEEVLSEYGGALPPETVVELEDGDVVLVQMAQQKRNEGFGLEGIPKGTLVWRNIDASLQREVRGLRHLAPPGMEVSVAVAGSEGEALMVTLTSEYGEVGVGVADSPLEKATKKPWTKAYLDSALKLRPGGMPDDSRDAAEGFWRRGGGTDEGQGLDTSRLEAGLLVPRSAVTTARRRATAELMEKRVHIHQIDDSTSAKDRVKSIEDLMQQSSPSSPSSSSTAKPKIALLCRSREQADAAADLPLSLVQEVQLDFLEAHGLQDAMKMLQAKGHHVAVCLPRVLKPGEDKLESIYRNLGGDTIVVRSTGSLHELTERHPGDAEQHPEDDYDEDIDPTLPAPKLVGDFSLNAANALTAAVLLDMGLDRLTPTHDLSAAQLCDLAKSLGKQRASQLEVIIHQHLPIFHTEHCVFCRFLTEGNDYTDCGHPCERGTLHLRDESGRDHRVMADMGCRNTVFNAEAQSAARDLERLQKAGYGWFRIELVDEPPEAVQPLVEGYYDVLHGSAEADALWSMVARLPDANGNPQGVGLGSLTTNTSHRDRPRSRLKPVGSKTRY